MCIYYILLHFIKCILQQIWLVQPKAENLHKLLKEHQSLLFNYRKLYWPELHLL